MPTEKGLVLPPAYLKNQCVVQAELVVDVSNHGEGVRAGDEVLLDYDCSSSACSFETASAALKYHVASRDSGSKVHRTILDNRGKTIAVGCYIRHIACRMRDVRVVGVRDELNLAVTAKQSQMSPITRYHYGRTDDMAGVICDEGGEAISIGGEWTLSCADGNDCQQQGENENKSLDCDKAFHDDLLHIDSK